MPNLHDRIVPPSDQGVIPLALLSCLSTKISITPYDLNESMNVDTKTHENYNFF